MEEGEALVFLDFKSKLANDIFDKDTFIRLANLHTKNPLIQINDTIFKGSFDHALGTNLFFEENQGPPKHTDIFIKRGPIQYENIANLTKIINMKPVKVPPRKVDISKEITKIEFNLDWDYDTLLQKFTEGSLQITDILKNVEQVEDEKDPKQDKEAMDVGEQPIVKNEVLIEVQEDEQTNLEFLSANILEEYNQLQKLAFRPMKIFSTLENIQECDPNYKNAYEYHNLERQVLQPCDFFRSEPVAEINEETLSDCVDIDRCILYGLLDKSMFSPRILTENEKRQVLTLANFDNISLAGRYYVLKNHIKDLREYIKKKNADELLTRDDYGRTAQETLKIYEKLTDAVRKRIEEIKFSLK